ncbi:MAG TPA: DUF4126 domain-containing protein [Chthoniobacteraceae bacterium]|nr:DUF4126 domain-containing protein [Chthoniobacteraceae bacterium]
METLQLLGTALGLGALAGLNLYLTVFVAGLAVRMEWIALAPQYSQLAILADPAIIAIAGLLYFLEFFADKVPWVDSLWDLVHSIIRPVGGAFLAIAALGTAAPVFDVIMGLLAGSVALSTHSLKAGARLVVNSSPEPFSNIALSVVEDVAVVGGLALVHLHPIAALGLVIVFVGFILYFGPKIARSVRTKAWLAWRKLKSPADVASEAPLPTALPADADMLLHSLKNKSDPHEFAVEWALPCITAGSKKLRANLSGHLVSLRDEPDRLHFVSKGWLGSTAQTLLLNGSKTAHESRFLSENLVLYTVGDRKKEVFYFERPLRQQVSRIAARLQERLAAPPSAPPLEGTAEPIPGDL